MKRRGLFIAIEGGDGSGKGTQAEILRKFLSKDKKNNVLKLSFPRYNETSSYYASQYLNGAYGTADQVPADLASLTYALDRYAAKKEISSFLKKPNSIVIVDRYVASNLAHQGTKCSSAQDRKAYYERIMVTEYEILGIPRPDKNIVLVVPTNIAQANVDKKEERTYTNKKRDIHESDSTHLDRAKANYEELCKIYPDEFIAINCIDKNGNLRPIDDIQKDIQKLVMDAL